MFGKCARRSTSAPAYVPVIDVWQMCAAGRAARRRCRAAMRRTSRSRTMWRTSATTMPTPSPRARRPANAPPCRCPRIHAKGTRVQRLLSLISNKSMSRGGGGDSADWEHAWGERGWKWRSQNLSVPGSLVVRCCLSSLKSPVAGSAHVQPAGCGSMPAAAAMRGWLLKHSYWLLKHSYIE